MREEGERERGRERGRERERKRQRETERETESGHYVCIYSNLIVSAKLSDVCV